MSSLSSLCGSAYTTTYAASKAFDTVLAEGLWQEFGPKGVDVVGCAGGIGLARRVAVIAVTGGDSGIGWKCSIDGSLLTHAPGNWLCIRPAPRAPRSWSSASTAKWALASGAPPRREVSSFTPTKVSTQPPEKVPHS